mmetsp:Transcript_18547/g.42314  ORF Transcript_18547/g.42314 Transcript_18547/m.42314 type:complete len:322 (-) Transcript_18547:2006-2971(-)
MARRFCDAAAEVPLQEVAGVPGLKPDVENLQGGGIRGGGRGGHELAGLRGTQGKEHGNAAAVGATDADEGGRFAVKGGGERGGGDGNELQEDSALALKLCSLARQDALGGVLLPCSDLPGGSESLVVGHSGHLLPEGGEDGYPKLLDLALGLAILDDAPDLAVVLDVSFKHSCKHLVRLLELQHLHVLVLLPLRSSSSCSFEQVQDLLLLLLPKNSSYCLPLLRRQRQYHILFLGVLLLQGNETPLLLHQSVGNLGLADPNPLLVPLIPLLVRFPRRLLGRRLPLRVVHVYLPDRRLPPPPPVDHQIEPSLPTPTRLPPDP